MKTLKDADLRWFMTLAPEGQTGVVIALLEGFGVADGCSNQKTIALLAVCLLEALIEAAHDDPGANLLEIAESSWPQVIEDARQLATGG